MPSICGIYGFLEDLAARRGLITVGNNPLRLGVELSGGKMVCTTSFEPDPTTFRDEYYYNVRTNALYKKVIVSHCDGMIVAFWKQASS